MHEAEERVKESCETVFAKDDFRSLKDYNAVKMELASQLRALRRIFAELGQKNAEERLQEITVDLAEDKFVLAVLGQFKRGKSSLMNAIVGREILPTGVLPLTSVITVLKYGIKERFIISRENSALPEELPVSEISRYVTEKGNPSNEKKIKTACVELPVPFLRRGVEFVDTPGVGSSVEANTRTAYEFLPQCDAAIFVTGADTPMNSIEWDFLEEIRGYAEKIFFVINKMDTVSREEAREITAFVAGTVKNRTGAEARVFAVSARKGMRARLEKNEKIYEESNIKKLEESLAGFLSERKKDIVLRKAAKAVLQTLAGIDGEVRGRDAAGRIAAAERKLELLYAGLENENGGGIEKEAPQRIKIFGPAALTPCRQSSAGDLSADMRLRECSVCHYVGQKIFDFLSGYQYQLYSDEETQKDFAEKNGFCPLHTWQLINVCSPYGASVGYSRIVGQAAQKLRIASAENNKGFWREVHAGSENCEICKLAESEEQAYITRLAALLETAGGRREYQNSQGLCLRHLSMLSEAADEKLFSFLLNHAAVNLEALYEDMQSFALKHEALCRALQNKNEADAYYRAAAYMAGGKNIRLA